MLSHPAILTGLPAELILACYANAPGNELESGKFASPESSAALAANTFGYFIDKAAAFPLPAELPQCRGPAISARPEATVRFPWAGGHHPCLDALVETAGSLIGIESKRYEPFRGKGVTNWSEAYWRPVWGTNMTKYEAMRDALRSGGMFQMLDAGQLVKHAFGLRSAVHHDKRHNGRRPHLLYIYAEPTRWPDGRLIDEAERACHRQEIARFSELVFGDEVSFASSSYRTMLAHWLKSEYPGVADHARAISAHFDV